MSRPDTEMGNSGSHPTPSPVLPVRMRREHLRELPEAPLPEGYRLRLFRPGDEAVWADLATRAGEFAERSEALRRFESEFAAFPGELQRRCLFLCGPDGGAVGTAMGWYGRPGVRMADAPPDVESWGRLHWVSIVPERQGLGLAKPLVAAALRMMAERHERAYLTTQTSSWKAIGFYLKIGFAPDPANPSCAEAWTRLSRMLPAKLLQPYWNPERGTWR